jgi:hypothetical protein
MTIKQEAPWSQLPHMKDWQYEVANGDTLLGYRDWLVEVAEKGECDTCGDLYDLASRDGRCGDCGECPEHCTHEIHDVPLWDDTEEDM